MSSVLVPLGVVEERRYDTCHRFLEANEQHVSTIWGRRGAPLPYILVILTSK